MTDSFELKKCDDAALIVRYKMTGDKACVGVLFERYTHLVLGVCMKYLKDSDEAKDVVMIIFEKLFDDLFKYEISYFKGWLHTVIKNQCFLKLRQAKNRISYIDEINMEKGIEDHQEEPIEMEAKLTLLESAIIELDSSQQVCIRLFYLEKKSYQQITDQTGFDYNQVKSFIQNGKRNLKIYMTRHER